MGVIKITREGDGIFAQLQGQPKVELLPRSESEFFSNDVNATTKFVKDDEGNAVEIVMNQAEIQVHGFKKMNQDSNGNFA